MDVLTAILACSLYRDDALVRAIAESNSHGNLYSVVDATLAAADGARHPERKSLEAALALASDIAFLGGEPLVGFMQLPVTWASVNRKEIGELFDPCANIAIGTAKLSDLSYECRHADAIAARKKNRPPPTTAETSPKRRACIIHAYALAIRMPEFEVVVHLELEHQQTAQLNNANPPIRPFWSRCLQVAADPFILDFPTNSRPTMRFSSTRSRAIPTGCLPAAR
jgi:hypothetical protein